MTNIPYFSMLHSDHQ